MKEVGGNSQRLGNMSLESNITTLHLAEFCEQNVYFFTKKTT